MEARFCTQKPLVTRDTTNIVSLYAQWRQSNKGIHIYYRDDDFDYISLIFILTIGQLYHDLQFEVLKNTIFLTGLTMFRRYSELVLFTDCICRYYSSYYIITVIVSCRFLKLLITCILIFPRFLFY